jgi:hypothetical protein
MRLLPLFLAWHLQEQKFNDDLDDNFFGSLFDYCRFWLLDEIPQS